MACYFKLTVIFCLLFAAFATVQPAFAAPSCANLTALRLPNTIITSATDVPEGQFVPPGTSMPIKVPAFCRVVGLARPTSDSIINFEVWMPPARAWNGKFEGVGNGGYSGAIDYLQMANGLTRGYATAGTDTGHTGEDLKFADGHPEKLVDWGQRAIHVMTENAKLVIRDYQTRFPQYSYFCGCSTGGMQALSEAERFPADYDGILAGDAGNDRIRLNAEFLWAFNAMHASESSYIPATKLPMINKAAIDSCDALDGVKDGIIDDPRRCHFDPSQLLCRGSDDSNCLTTTQVEAAKKIYAGPRNPRTGEQIYFGYEAGSESPVGDPTGGWQSYIAGVSQPMRLDFWKYWVFHDPNWDWHTFDFDRDLAYAEMKLGQTVNSTDPNLSAFRGRGGKLLMYHGWADPVGPPRESINFYEKVMRMMGSTDGTTGFLRLFMVPGMAHCNNGPGPTPFAGPWGSSFGHWETKPLEADPEHDLFSALDRWVQHGVAPDHVIASHVSNGTVDRTRPICAYPKVARWKGVGSTDDASNFACVVGDD